MWLSEFLSYWCSPWKWFDFDAVEMWKYFSTAKLPGGAGIAELPSRYVGC